MSDPVEISPGKWKVRVFLGRDTEGRQIRRSKTFPADGIRRAKAHAKVAGAELEAEYAASLEAPHRWSLAEAAENWWTLWTKRQRSPTTRKGYRSILDRHILTSPLAGEQIGGINVGQVERWYAALPVGPSTVKRIHAVLTQIFDQAVRDELIDRNPAALAYKPESRPKAKTHTSVGDVRRVLEAAHAVHPARSRALAFSALTGLRRGEMCGIRWSALDIEQGILIVGELGNVVATQQRFIDPTSDSHDAVLHAKDPKAHQAAAIALGSEATEIARQQIEWQAKQGASLGDDPYLWAVKMARSTVIPPPPPFTVPLHPDTMSHWFAGAARKAGVSGVSLHDLRHWQGSQVLEVGGTVQDVKERLRHKSLQTTMGYLHADHSKQRVLVDLLPRLELGPSTEG